ncbi:neurogenic locus notch homolog protein 1-like [Ylistrum balloti]|uniref:neurogenic locus notch homolog protein 1-like n=1 Tax=Ylistrum balloti TaxID=509963 RepID=UPI002905ED43|nr:neurogenic locus notch homolog protein 1-like [Ylistrum balloti]
MDWPARYPDLNPIEHVWDRLQNAVSPRNIQPRTLQELQAALVAEWTSIPLNRIRDLIRSMRRRCQSCYRQPNPELSEIDWFLPEETHLSYNTTVLGSVSMVDYQMKVAAIVAWKIQAYTNPDKSCKTNGKARQCCDGGTLPDCDTDTCDTHFRICVNNDPHDTGNGNCVDTIVRPDTNQLSTCGDVRLNHTTNQLDIASTYISTTDTWSWVCVTSHMDSPSRDMSRPGTSHCENSPGTYRCTCNSGWTGRNCSQDIDECQHTPCENGGTCNNTIGSYTCACQGFSGHNCENEINECQHTKCPHKNMHCVNSVGSYTCKCYAGWTGDHCDTDVNECQHKPCEHGGTCNNTIGSYTCSCHGGYNGHNCNSDVNECHHQNPCQHGGTCNNTIGSYTCACQGFSGHNCENDINECQHTKCPHKNMHCVNSVGSYTCTCNNTIGSYTCACQGFSGHNCENDINECQHTKCPHKNMHCVNSVGSYTCKCNAGWTGDHCDTDVNECQHNPCEHGGTCNNTIGSYTCSCHGGYNGHNCNSDVNECHHQNPCQHARVTTRLCACQGFSAQL